MADSNNRVRIDFDVNAQELKEITNAINILDKFNKQASQVTGALGALSGAMNNNSKASKKQKDEYVDLDRAMNAWNSRLQSNKSMMSSYEASQAKLTEKLKQYGRDVKVTVDQQGKLSASFKNAEGNMVSMTGKYNVATNSIKDMKTTLSTAALEVKKKAEADKKAAQEMDRLHASALKVNKGIEDQKKRYAELTRGTDLSNVLKANANSFDAMNNAVKMNATIVRASTDRNGKFTQTLRMQDGTLRTVTGYYDQANKKLVQYSESVSRAEGAVRRASGASSKFNRDLTTLERSMQGLNRYTLTWAEAIEIAGTRMLQWNVAGTVIFGLQRAFHSLLSTIVEIDTQMTQLVRVLPETTNFEEMWEDSIRLSTTFGRTLTDINEGLITFARSGFNNVDTRFLTEAATLMANVSDIDMFDASETLTSAITLFNVEARDAIQIVNKLNEVDNDYSISTQQLAKSITRAGGTAASFGVDLNELIGHTTAIGVATRESGQIIGNSLKSIYSRVNTLPKAQKAIEELGIALTLPNGDNRAVADIMDDIAKKWPELNNAQKQNTAINVAGTYQLNRFLALMNNYQMGLDATETAQKSYNSAVKENEKFMVSLQAKLNLLKSAAQQLAMSLGEAGLYAAIQVILEGTINLVQGFNQLVKTFGAFSFAIPVAAAALGIFIAQYQKTRLEMVAFQATMLGMNTSLSRQALFMSTTATTSTVLSGAFATLRTAALGVTAALLTNPLTWIAVALTAIPMLIGHYQRLKAEHDALMKKAEDNTKAFKDFKAEISKGDVNQTSIDVFTAKTDVAGKALEKLKKAQEEVNKAKKNSEAAYIAAANGHVLGAASIQEYTNWQDKLTKKTKEELADIGIKYDKYKSIGELMNAVKDRQGEYSEAVSAGNKVLEEAEKKLMFHADAFEEVGEEVKETMDIMELFFGVNDQMIQELIGSYNAIQVLSKVKEKDNAQTMALEQAWAVWEERLGMTREEIMKNPAVMQENIKWQQSMADKWGETTGKVLTNEQQKQLAVDITKQKTQESALEQTLAEQEAARKKAEAAEAEAIRKGKAFDEFRKNMQITDALNNGVTANEVANASLRSGATKTAADKNILNLRNEVQQSGITGSSYDKMKNIQIAANSSRINKQSSATSEINKHLDKERRKALETGGGFEDMSKKASSSNKTVESTTKTTVDRNNGKLDSMIKKLGDLKLNWKTLADVMSSPIIGTAKMTIKGIIDWFGGKGGGTDPLQALGGNMRGAGFGGLTMTSGFGTRRDPFTGAAKMHNGVDFAGPVGSPIRSNTGGQVIFSGYGQSGTGYGGYGNVVAIRDSSGLTHMYAHNSANYVRTGSFVQAGQTIAALGSTGNSTGPHSHYEVRAGARAINPMSFVGRGGGTDPLKDLMKFHSGGVVGGGGYQPPSASRRNNEVDVRVLRGEMILTKQQQSQLFDMAGLSAPKHKYHTGGIAGGPSWKNAGSFKGMGGGGSYTIKWGDTLSEIAVRFNTTVKNLMSLNSQIKDANKIYAGNVIKISNALQSATPAPQPASLYSEYKAGNYSDAVARINEKKALGIYTSTSNEVWALRNVARGKAKSDDEKRSYNKDMYDALSQVDNMKTFDAWFKNAGWYMPTAEIEKVRASLTAVVKENAFKKMQDSSSAWLDTFKEGLTEASDKVKNIVSLNESIKKQQEDLAKSQFVDSFVSQQMDAFGFEKLSEADKIQQQLDQVKSEAEQRINQNAEIQWATDPNAIEARRNELRGQITKVREQMAKVEADAVKNGITGDKYQELVNPLKNQIEELMKEYDGINISATSNSEIFKENKEAIEALSKEYAELQDQLEAATKEKFDDFGNVIRNLSGEIVTSAMAAQAAANALASGNELLVNPSTGEPVVNPVTYDQTGGSSVTETEPKVYAAGGETKNVTFILNVGTAIGTESELREFGLMLKSLVEEEEGRGES